MTKNLFTEVAVRRKVKDGWYVYTCDELPGLYVAHTDDKVAYNDVPAAISMLLKLDLGVECSVTHKLCYNAFVRMVESNGADETASGMVASRTRELIEECEHLPFIVQHKRDRHPSE